ncbi:MAG: hypothetical protein COB20_12460 [SAR86 cluster bacterium]|uniref:PKD domain-containing protein n=1 Tax=SAR86 cluster bacterium TaxID=2030880 RepID=A0A2A4WZD4_9GAMM|nr:MAG: hypothetical protein COB20_12460 [SAR86 cluster bacterium]
MTSFVKSLLRDRLMSYSFEALCLGFLFLFLSAQTSAQNSRVDAPIPHSSGQSVSPSYEGWYPNPDGSFSLVFGYFNRNYDEHVALPVGPDNRMEPGPMDQGQPTYFYPRRQTGVFAVVVPAGFGAQALVWSLTAHGQTVSIPGHLRPEWEITALEEVTSGNTPPVLRFGSSEGPLGQGPLGLRSERLTIAVNVPTEIQVWATDDGVQKSRATRQARHGVVWSKYRGTGTVSFENSTPNIENGKAVTFASFSEPGNYVLRVLGWDDSGGQNAIMAGGFFCCWTNGFLMVEVTP